MCVLSLICVSEAYTSDQGTSECKCRVWCLSDLLAHWWEWLSRLVCSLIFGDSLLCSLAGGTAVYDSIHCSNTSLCVQRHSWPFWWPALCLRFQIFIMMQMSDLLSQDHCACKEKEFSLNQKSLTGKVLCVRHTLSFVAPWVIRNTTVDVGLWYVISHALVDQNTHPRNRVSLRHR